MAYQAYSKHGKMVAATPKMAATKYFQAFPKSRKCNIIEGEDNGFFFTVRYGRKSEGDWPSSFKDITKKMIDQLPS